MAIQGVVVGLGVCHLICPQVLAQLYIADAWEYSDFQGLEWQMAGHAPHSGTADESGAIAAVIVPRFLLLGPVDATQGG